MKLTALTLSLAWALLAAAPAVRAHQDKQDGHGPAKFTAYGEQLPFGRVGKSAEAARTVVVEMRDDFHFVPGSLRVRAGETVRLVFRNKGVQLHEWVLGTSEKIAEHAALMKRFPNMEHGEPHNVHVPPGEERELVWQFNRPGSYQFACLLPGHFEAGMNGTVEVR